MLEADYDTIFSIEELAEIKYNMHVMTERKNLTNEKECEKWIESFQEAIDYEHETHRGKIAINFTMNKDFNPDWLNELIKRLAEHKEDVKFVTRSSGGNDFIIVRTHSNFDIIGLITEPDKRIDRALIQCNNITSPLTQATTTQLVKWENKKKAAKKHKIADGF